MAKKMSWEELEQRGGPFTAEELGTLYDRPGITKVGSHAWHCDTCGSMKGQYTTQDLTTTIGPPKPVAGYYPPATPEERAELDEVHAAGSKAYDVLQAVRQRIADTQAKREVAVAASRRAESDALRSGTTVDQFEVTRHEATISMCDAQIAELKAAEAEALERLGVARNEEDNAEARVLAARDGRRRAAIEEAKPQEQRGTALSRLLSSGKLGR